MAILVMVYGQSGTGKSTSFRNFNNDEVAIINVSGKPMPFRSELKTLSSNDYSTIAQWLPQIKQPSIIIDDVTYLMADQFFRCDLTKKDYGQKYEIIAQNFALLLERARLLEDDKVIYFVGHTEYMDNGTEHFKTIGKVLDQKLTVEGKFTVVLKSVVQDGHYYFQTHNSGFDTVKSPLGMFEEDLIDNDLKMVDDVIREFWNIPRPIPEE